MEGGERFRVGGRIFVSYTRELGREDKVGAEKVIGNGENRNLG